MGFIWLYLSIMKVLWASPSAYEVYRHDYIIAGTMVFTDLNHKKCSIKVPHEEFTVYLEEVSSFLIPRPMMSDLDADGAFSFPVETRYSDYRLYLVHRPSKFRVYETKIPAYNAPETYHFTLSCVDDLKKRE